MKLGSGIERLFPNAILRGDAIVQDDGQGPRVAYWNARNLGPMPSLESLDAAGQQAEQEVAEEKADKSTLREQIIGATEAQWLGLTEAQRQKIVLKALKYVARNL